MYDHLSIEVYRLQSAVCSLRSAICGREEEELAAMAIVKKSQSKQARANQ